MKKELPLKKICRESQCHQWATTVCLEGCWKCQRFREYYFCKHHWLLTNFVKYCQSCGRNDSIEVLMRTYERDGWVQQWL